MCESPSDKEQEDGAVIERSEGGVAAVVVTVGITNGGCGFGGIGRIFVFVVLVVCVWSRIRTRLQSLQFFLCFAREEIMKRGGVG